jgi:hypothetical protein
MQKAVHSIGVIGADRQLIGRLGREAQLFSLWLWRKRESNTSDILFVCLFICFESQEQFFSYLATVTIAGNRAANLDLCLALTAFSSEGSFTCHTYCDTGPPFLRSYPKDT